MGYLRPAPLDAEGEAFAALYRRHFGLVWSLTLHLGVPAAAREDVAQEVWMTIHRRMGALREGASMRAWVASITRHVVLHHRRADGRRSRKHAALTVVTGVCEEIHHADAITTIDDTLRAMDPAQRETFVLVAVAELTGPEVAQVLGVPLNTVYSRLRLARARLAMALSDAHTEERQRAAEAGLRDEPNTQGAASRVWLALVTDLGWREATPSVVSATTTGLTGKLAVVATSALATVLGTAALGGLGDRSAHADAVPAASVAVIDDAARDPRTRPVPEVDARAPATVHEVAAIPTGDPMPMPSDDPREVVPGTTVPARHAAPHASAAAAKTRASVKATPAQVDDGAPSSIAAKPLPDMIGAEAALLGEARRALRDGDPSRARLILTEHATTFADGRLAIDRRALWARMLCAAGDAAAAREHVQALLRDQPRAPAAVAVRDVCTE
jgi:RNA polymerase sigma-70 factor (ECF subfamily)